MLSLLAGALTTFGGLHHISEEVRKSITNNLWSPMPYVSYRHDTYSHDCHVRGNVYLPSTIFLHLFLPPARWQKMNSPW